ncbi:MAG: iron ABC transporter permease [Pasteurellaceae bacterium]|nr:iron ABC transporter permease [Pasteurellaceae bacterium]
MKNYQYLLYSLLILLLGLGIMSLSLGRYFIPLNDVIASIFGKNTNDVQNNIIFNLRLTRVISAMLVGAALAVAGTVYQGVFRNPLVSPDLLGVSSGACVGASIAILFSLNIFAIQITAFIGGILAVLCTMLLPKLIQKDSTIILVLSGIIVSGFMLACLGLLKYLADPETQLAEIVYWQLGSLAKSDYKNLLILAPIMLITILLLFLLRWRINLLSLGENEARLVGVNVTLERNLFVVCATLLTASAVCLSGTIGWVGLIIPHLARLFIGDDNVRSLPISMLIGAIFMLIVDTLSRNIYVQEIPLGILTGFIGAPFFAYVLTKQKVGH